MENQWLYASVCLLYLIIHQYKLHQPVNILYTYCFCVGVSSGISVGGEEGEEKSHIERDKRSEVKLVSHPASCASCALMTDSKLLVCKNSHTAG